MAGQIALAILPFKKGAVYGRSSMVESRSPKPLMGVRISPPVQKVIVRF